jgi:hypothetical protein
MQTGQMSEQAKRQRKMLLVLPLIVVPLLALVFHGLGGGTGKKVKYSGNFGKGLNMNLPDARFDPKKKAMNKMGVYTQAERDSMRLRESRKQDPYYLSGGGSLPGAPGSEGSAIRAFKPDTDWRKSPAARSTGLMPGLGPSPTGPEEQAGALLQKLNELKGVLSKQASGQSIPSMPEGLGRTLPFGSSVPASRVPSMAGLTGSTGDPDLDKLSGMLDKILKIQHPGAVDTSAPAVAAARPVALVSGVPHEEGVGALMGSPAGADTSGVIAGSGFMEMDETPSVDSVADNLFAAVVEREQTLVSGESVALRLTEPVVWQGVSVPAGTVMAAKSSLSGERLLLQVSSIRVGSRSLAVSLEVVDQDGMPGIREEGSINRDAAKQSAGEAISGLGLTSLDQSVGALAATAGIEAAKELVSRKVKMVRVGIPAGYKVFLRNSKTYHNQGL